MRIFLVGEDCCALTNQYGRVDIDAVPAQNEWEFCGGRNTTDCKLPLGYVIDPEMECLATAPLPDGSFIVPCNALVAKEE